MGPWSISRRAGEVLIGSHFQVAVASETEDAAWVWLEAKDFWTVIFASKWVVWNWGIAVYPQTVYSLFGENYYAGNDSDDII